MMRRFIALRTAVVWMACLAAGFGAGVLVDIFLVQRSLQGVQPDSTTGVTFFSQGLILVPCGLLLGTILAITTLWRLRQRTAEISTPASCD